MRQEHRVGEKLFIDFSGDGIDIVDPSTGEVKVAKLFVTVLGASSYTYVATGVQVIHFHRDHRGPEDHPVAVRRFSARAGGARTRWADALAVSGAVGLLSPVEFKDGPWPSVLRVPGRQGIQLVSPGAGVPGPLRTQGFHP